MRSYNDYHGIKEQVGNELILHAAGNDALAPLKKQCISFRDSTVLLVITTYT
jgi:hypothetical protein